MNRRAFSLPVTASLLVVLVGGSALAATSRAPSSSSVTIPARHGSSFVATDLVSDQPGQASHTDPNLVNAWGLVAGPATPWWVSDNGTDRSTLYDGAGNIQSLVVDVAGAPTGTVFNGGTGFVVSHDGASGPSVFLFATESGTILGWNPTVPPPPPSTEAFVVVDRSSQGAIYKGLAIASTDDGDFLYATDFHNGRVDMFDGTFNLVTPPGAFIDRNIPPHYAPFGIQSIGDVLFVTYAKQDADAEDDVPGRGHGFVDMYDTNGALLDRVVVQGHLDSPWGLAMAPARFGSFGGDLLVGNFGDGVINAFHRGPNGSFTHVGELRTGDGGTIAIDGLWALRFGNDGPAGPSDTLFFTAGPEDESHGLFGKIEATG